MGLCSRGVCMDFVFESGYVNSGKRELFLIGLIALLILYDQGVITICQGVTKSFGGLVACRFLLGVFEAGFVPGLFIRPGSYLFDFCFGYSSN